MKCVLVCVDQSPESAGAAVVNAAIVAFARSLVGSELHVLYVADPEPDFVAHEVDTPEQRDVLAADLRERHTAIETLTRSLRADGLRASPHVVRGRVAEAILETAKKIDADAIVVGSNGHNRMRSLLLGSVTDALLRR